MFVPGKPNQNSLMFEGNAEGVFKCATLLEASKIKLDLKGLPWTIIAKTSKYRA